MLITVIEAARLLSLQPRTLMKWRKENRGPPFMKLEGSIRYAVKDIEYFKQINAKLCDGLNWQIRDIMDELRVTEPRYNDWPELRIFILRSLPRTPKAPTTDQGPLIHTAYALMANRSALDWDSLLLEVERELKDRAMLHEGKTPWDEE
jgi:DNA-binding transcriptional MerR regulator